MNHAHNNKLQDKALENFPNKNPTKCNRLSCEENSIQLGWVGLGWVCVPGMQQLLRQSRPQPGVCSNCWLRDTTVSTLLIVNILPPSPLCLPCLPCLLCAFFSVSCVVSPRKHRRQENAAPCVVGSGRRRSSGGGRGDKEGEVGGVASAR